MRHTDCNFRHREDSLPEELLVLLVRICARLSTVMVEKLDWQNWRNSVCAGRMALIETTAGVKRG